MAAHVYGATEASTWHKGRHYTVHVDEPWPADHELVKAVPSLFRFEPATPGGREPVPVEAATKAPGERRTTRRG